LSFVLSKLLWLIANPANMLVFAASLGLWRFCVTRARFWGAVAWLALGTMLLVGIVPIGHWLIIPLEDRFPRPASPPADVTGIIILGGAQSNAVTAARGILATNDYAERLIEGLSLARRFPNARVVFSGGSPELIGERPSEAIVNAALLELLPVTGDRVVMEERSRNTFENAVYTKQLINPAPDEVWLLVTTAFHMPRSIGVFRAVGWDVVPWPVDYQTTGRFEFDLSIDIAGGLNNLNIAMHEIIGLVAYRLMGRTGRLLPGP